MTNTKTTMLLDPSKFSGKVMQRQPLTGTLTEWVASAYQYAYTSIQDPENECNPAYIIYVENDNDIFLAMEYAVANDIGIAVRSGGHQYNAASSTAFNNIQIDLSGRESSQKENYLYKKVSIEDNNGDKYITIGCGVALGDISELLIQNGLFFPRGECATVHIGGHSNTGGMSPITPIFGAMIDHVVEFEFICSKYPDGTKTIRRPDLWIDDKEKGIPQQENDELFWAVLGGSPGNFGILTHLTIKCLKDADYPHTRGLKLAWPYSKEAVEAISQIVCEVSDNPELSAYASISAVVVGPEYFYPHRHPSAPLKSKGGMTLDDEMLKQYPELAGEDKFNYVGLGHGMIAVYGAFLNPTGNENYEEQLKQFEEVRDKFLKVPGCIPPKDFPIIKSIVKGIFNIAEWFEEKILGNKEKAAELDAFHKSLELDDIMYGEKYIPISQVLNNLSWDNPREYSLSYKKLSYMGNSRAMSKVNNQLSTLPIMKGVSKDNLRFSTWLANEIHSVVSSPDTYHGMYMAVQFGVIGGPGLVNPQSSGGGQVSYNSLSHRASNFWFDYDVFFNPEIEGCTENTQQYIDGIAHMVINNTINLFKDGKQQRVLLGPSFPLGEKPILDKYWSYFYDSEEQYNQLCQLKTKFDEKNVFTANLMCVGATKVKRMQPFLDHLMKDEELSK
ncbi:FAD-binding oxidoreductase [Flammeovirga pacifica]|uniref:FAD-binding PCMH-type domain-containing protein n=1 Tax=Flammeovirga pacifica TaxID=915059 RepID=A0A1S1Z005_FLAPC|nr:FAD-dependent oxidoreductase [Flammeovirga pacifica]OHX66598.1 hypothetical protein NH26_09615 [Flammeovirga pacifica]